MGLQNYPQQHIYFVEDSRHCIAITIIRNVECLDTGFVYKHITQGQFYVTVYLPENNAVAIF